MWIREDGKDAPADAWGSGVTAVLGRAHIAPAGRRRRGIGIRPPVWFLVPAIVLYTAIVVAPNLRGFAYSFTDWDGITDALDVVGFANFAHVFDDANSFRALLNTLQFTVVVTIVQNVAGLLLALACNSLVKSRYWLRLVFFLPVVLTPIVSAYLWSYLLNPDGTVNQFLHYLGLDALRQDWLGDPSLSLWAIAIAAVWQGVGFTMVIYLAALQTLPHEVMEAAAIDGAGPLRRLLRVTIPLINGAVVINVMLTLTACLKQFDLVFAMTNGGPAGATETMAFIIYKNAFTNLDYPTAVAQGVLLTLIVAVVAIVQVRVTSRRED